MSDEDKEEALVEMGWTVFDLDAEDRAWKAPVSMTGRPLYFTLDDAFDLETNGEGIYEYAAEDAMGDYLREEDLRLMVEREAEEISNRVHHAH